MVFEDLGSRGVPESGENVAFLFVDSNTRNFWRVWRFVGLLNGRIDRVANFLKSSLCDWLLECLAANNNTTVTFAEWRLFGRGWCWLWLGLWGLGLLGGWWSSRIRFGCGCDGGGVGGRDFCPRFWCI